MKRTALMISSVTSLLLAGTAFAADAIVYEEPILTPAERQMVVEVNVWGGYLWRTGDAIDDDGDEDDGFPLMGGGGLAAVPIGDSWLWQTEISGEGSFYDDDLDVNDTYAGSITAGMQAAWTSDQYLFGAFAGGGKTFNVDQSDDDDQNATHYFAGLAARTNFNNLSFAAQGGYLGSNSDDGEHIDDAFFIRGIGQAFFNGGRTMLQGDIAYANGTQDYDSDPEFQDDTDLIAWGLELEHTPDLAVGGGALSVFAAYEGIHVIEHSVDSGDEKLTDHTVRVGLKFRFGAMTPQDRERNTAPDLPNFGRWLGAVPAVD